MAVNAKLKALVISLVPLMCAIALLTGAPYAQADPIGSPKPLVSFCVQWEFIGDTYLAQSDGWGLEFYSKGAQVQDDRAVSFGVENLRRGEGATVAGGISGTRVNLKVRWDSGVLRTYKGAVDANGIASGEFYDDPAKRGNWRTMDPLECVATDRTLEVPPGS